MTLFVIDIDGTLSDARERYSLAGPEPDRTQDPKAYQNWLNIVMNPEYINNSEYIGGMVELIQSLVKNPDNKVIYLTARNIKHYMETLGWLVFNEFPSNIPLIMRPESSTATSAEFKRVAIQEFGLYADTVVIDDDPRGDIEQMCKEEGYTFLKARSGSY